jgi:hypothetical protein
MSEESDRRITLLQIFNIIQEFNKNLILVSQVRGPDERVYYENKKILDFMAYKAEVKPIEDGCIVNDRYKINKNFLNLEGGY